MRLKTKALELVSFAASDDSRPVLAAVWLMPDGSAVAADGFRLAMMREAVEEPLPVPVKVGVAGVRLAKRLATKREESVGIGLEEGEARLLMDLAEVRAEIPEGTVPSYAGLWPKEKPLASVAINARYLADVAALGKKSEYGMVRIHIWKHSDPVQFRVGEEYHLLVMPMYVSDADDGTCGWRNLSPEDAAAAAKKKTPTRRRAAKGVPKHHPLAAGDKEETA